MPKRAYSATEAARELGISVDTLRRWDREGRIRTKRDSANRRVVALEEIERLRGEAGAQHMSARNRLRGTVTEVRVEGLLAQVRLRIGDQTLTAVITRDAVEELKLRRGDEALAIVKSTEVMVAREAEAPSPAPAARTRRAR
jgi:molybdopterin-binding protein